MTPDFNKLISWLDVWFHFRWLIIVIDIEDIVCPYGIYIYICVYVRPTMYVCVCVCDNKKKQLFFMII